MKRGLVVALVILASGLNRACETGVIGGKGGAPAATPTQTAGVPDVPWCGLVDGALTCRAR